MSIVIPTHRRPDLVRKLLESVREDSANVTFPVEVLLVDDTPKDEYGLLDLYAEQFGARILTGESHVGAKRNRGAKEARYEYILFLDSDVVIQKGTLAAHYHALAEGGQKRVGGCLGLVVFVGKRTFAWDVISAMQLTLPFSYPLVAEVVPWGPTANLSFRRSAFDDVGGFDLGLPRYGGEDVDIGLRMSKAGYLIATTKDAVAEHTIETWSSWRQNSSRPRAAQPGSVPSYSTAPPSTSSKSCRVSTTGFMIVRSARTVHSGLRRHPTTG